MGLVQHPEHVDFADIVYQSEHSPLYIHFLFGANRESVHMFLHTDIGEYRLNNLEPPGIDFLTLFAIDLCLHLIDQVRWLRLHLYGEIPPRSRGLAQALRSQRAGGVIFYARMMHIIGSIAVCLVVRMTSQFFSIPTEIHLFITVKRIVRSAEETRLRVCALPAVGTRMGHHQLSLTVGAVSIMR
jgi:hypothetical protein